MKVAVCVLTVFASALAIPIENIDTFNIKPIDILRAPTYGEIPLVTGSRIIGGTVAPRNSIPYQAALIINDSGFCGGSLITQTFALTAAHCVDSASQTQVILGAHNPLTNENTQLIERTTEHIVHPAWNRRILQNDIALVKLSKVRLTDEIQLVALAPSNAPSYAGNAAILSGWGRTSDSSNTIASELKRVDLEVITNDMCRNVFSIIIQPQHICTSGQGVVGACNGDSGGPLTVQNIQVGIVSFGSGTCEAQAPTAYARVSLFSDWINNNTLTTY
ncbi:brachyurin-like [Euwallacea fornicatus]|uniref:brachyurin-like n=1 Tax=Euwallacea fornicatus TaxID=995702 RepID=UPI00339021F6